MSRGILPLARRFACVVALGLIASHRTSVGLEAAAFDLTAMVLLAVLVASHLTHVGRSLLARHRLKNMSRSAKATALYAILARSHRAPRVAIASDAIASCFLAYFLSQRALLSGAAQSLGEREISWFSAGSMLAALVALLDVKLVRRMTMQIRSTPSRAILSGYVGATIVAALLLTLPVSLQAGAALSVIDALFVAASAITVTGLSPIDITATLSPAGLLLILCLIQVGGLGVVAVAGALSVLVRHHLSLGQAVVGQEMFGLQSAAEFRPFMARVLRYTLVIEGVGAAALLLTLPAGLPWFHAVFHAVSAFCNAGFSTFGGNLEVATPGFRAVTCVLIALGGLGFSTLFDLARRVRVRGLGGRSSEVTRLALLAFVILFFGGTAAIFGVESLEGGRGSSAQTLGEAAFYSISSRTAGFNARPVASLVFDAQVVILLLMVIGGASLSTAGGIKTNTVSVIVAAVISGLRGHRNVRLWRSDLPAEVLQRAVTVVCLYGLTAFVAYLAIAAIEPHNSFAVLFEVVSALSTVGLSLDVTARLSDGSKLIIIFLMIVGRIGIFAAVFAGLGQVREQRFRYPKSRIPIG